ncbi:hypothetical protein Q5762_17585 [Streptomyces sp. P9(2023)]|nr:hypothetical protein [Streptomyces sp. P9(2023)]
MRRSFGRNGGVAGATESWTGRARLHARPRSPGRPAGGPRRRRSVALGRQSVRQFETGSPRNRRFHAGQLPGATAAYPTAASGTPGTH